MNLKSASILVLAFTIFSASSSFANQNRSTIRNWAKGNERRSATFAGGLIPLPQSGEKKKIDEEKAVKETEVQKEEKK